ncbi:MAG: DnaJ domain-containing protein [Crocinitomix sp.]|nr:DnaJ domain-containing protein [Crocinitomix sp.]
MLDNLDIHIEEKYLKFILAIGVFIFAGLFTGSVIAGIFLAITFMWIRYMALSKSSPGGLFKKKDLNNEADFVQIILLLSAAVIKADKRIYQKERDLVKRRLEYDFSPREVVKYMRDLEICLDKRILVNQICDNIKYKLDTPTKLQLLNFLTGITVSNGLMIDAEYRLLAKIARLLKIPERSFRSILALFKYKRIASYDNPKSKAKSNSKSRKKTYSKSRTLTSKLALAYIVLEIDETAMDDAVKKAYRKLAKIHHPDRVVHLGPQFQKSAKVKFQKIAEAYETVKQKRGFK